MPDAKQPLQFFPVGEFPVVTGSTPFIEAFARFSDRATGAFICVEVPGTEHFVHAHQLAARVVEAAAGDEVELNRLESTPIDVLLHQMGDPSVQVPIGSLDLDASVGEAELYASSSSVIAVSRSGALQGWYLREEIIGEIHTPKTIFLCAKNHPNPDYDSGRCGRCGRRLTKKR